MYIYVRVSETICVRAQSLKLMCSCLNGLSKPQTTRRYFVYTLELLEIKLEQNVHSVLHFDS